MSTTPDDGRTDEELLGAVSAGDRHALRALYERHAPWLVLRLSRPCADPGVVDQAVQDTFLAVWRKPDSYQGGGAVAAWLWGIGVRRLLDQLRRRPAATWAASDDEVQISAEDQVLLGVEHGDLAACCPACRPNSGPSSRPRSWTASPPAKRAAFSGSRPAPSRPVCPGPARR